MLNFGWQIKDKAKPRPAKSAQLDTAMPKALALSGYFELLLKLQYRIYYFLIIGETMSLQFREHFCAIDSNLKGPASRFYQFGRNSEFPLQCFRQTGGRGKVVSLHAIFNLYFHRSQLSANISSPII
jgi:hypothetical protein